MSTPHHGVAQRARRRSQTDHETGPAGKVGRRLRLLVLCPHFAPDTAPTGDVMTRIVAELAELGHQVDVVTSLPWYRDHQIEQGWGGSFVRKEHTQWGSITRVHPFPGDDKRNLVRRALGFVGFSALAAVGSLRGGRVDAVIAMSPPLTLGLTGWLAHLVRRGPLVFNIQDIFPDAAIATGAITNRGVIGVARWLERVSYHRSAAVTVLSDDLRDNVATKMRPTARSRVVVIPNFVDTAVVRPGPRMTSYRADLGIGEQPLVMYAGNVGYSQSLELMLDAARALPQVAFVINGDGSARQHLQRAAAGIANLHFVGYQPKERLAEVLASADLHVVALRSGLGNVSVPSKSYSIMAAGRPILAAIDADTEVPRMIAAATAGRTVAPDNSPAFVAAVASMVADLDELAAQGAAARRWVESVASPHSVAVRYVELVRRLGGG